ncbi:unnamed protein product [Vitrella brassicaformis CCMP3155]|uniref:SSD domain-containing protein n=2 Tax=Vitrella brassicaformis TaxID=1169539 RepID=A0A0G4EEX1_VITBC|nr:unnamed protein product [Vitrella brassicaformis CCMP3155]|eukprot:CEL94248.1 unnamed protein product [Vitrella brassicaformis CCMP3155]
MVRKKGWLEGWAAWTNSFFSQLFFNIGWQIGKRPLAFMAVSIACVLLCSIGFVCWKEENPPDKLWVPQDNISNEHRDFIADNFGDDKQRLNYVIIRAKDDNVLSVRSLTAIQQMHAKLLSLQARMDKKYRRDFPNIPDPFTFSDVCVSQGTNKCLLPGLPEVFDLASPITLTQADILSAVDANEEEITPWLGKIRRDGAGKIVGAEAVIMTYFITAGPDFEIREGGDDVHPAGLAWEQEALDEVFFKDNDDLDFAPLMDRTLSDTFGDAIQGDISALFVGYLLLLGYLFINLGKRDVVHSNRSVSLHRLPCPTPVRL